MIGILLLFRRRSKHAFLETATSFSASNRFKAIAATGSRSCGHRDLAAAKPPRLLLPLRLSPLGRLLLRLSALRRWEVPSTRPAKGLL